MRDKYLQKIEELRGNDYSNILSPLLDYLEQYRPGEPHGMIDSEAIRCILDGIVDIEKNQITKVMVQLGYKIVFCEAAGDYGWNMTDRVIKGDKLREEP